VTELTSLVVVEETDYNDSMSSNLTPYDSISGEIYLLSKVDSSQGVSSLAGSLSSSSATTIIAVVIAVIVLVAAVTAGSVVAVIIVVVAQKKYRAKKRHQDLPLNFTSPLAINTATNSSEMTTEVKKQEVVMTNSGETLGISSEASKDIPNENVQGNMEEDDGKRQLIHQECEVWFNEF